MTRDIYFIYNNDLNHTIIKEKGYGASEFQFYMIAKELSLKGLNITIFNSSNIDSVYDNILYRKYSDIENGKNINNSAIVVFMRMFKEIHMLLRNFNKDNIYIWSEDYVHSQHNPPYLVDINTINTIRENNIKIITVSEFHKNNIVSVFNINPLNVTVIYNALYSSIFINDDIDINKNNIVFASAWSKGLDKIIYLFDALHARHSHFKLVLMRPNYNRDIYSQRNYIELLDTVDSKEEYSKIIKSSLCVLTSEYPETFGCVFAEAYHLGTPVIATNIRNGLHEFIDNSYTCNFNNPTEFINLVEKIYNNRPCVKLDEKFYDTAIIHQWHNLLHN